MKQAVDAAAREGRILSSKGINMDALLSPSLVQDQTPATSMFSSVRPLNWQFAVDILTKLVDAATCEKDYQKCIMELGWAGGWKMFHCRKVLVKMGEKCHYETPYIGDGEGNPDLECIRERFMKVEVKFKKGRLEPEQIDRIELLRAAGIETHVWWPKDWEKAIVALRPRESPQKGGRKSMKK